MVRNQRSAWICHLEFDGAVEIPLQICMQGVTNRLFDNKQKVRSVHRKLKLQSELIRCSTRNMNPSRCILHSWQKKLHYCLTQHMEDKKATKVKDIRRNRCSKMSNTTFKRAMKQNRKTNKWISSDFPPGDGIRTYTTNLISKSTTISDGHYMGCTQSALLLSPSLLLDFFLRHGRRYGYRTFTH